MRTTPSLVLFDLDGVLATYDRATRVAHLANSLSVRVDAVWSALFDSGLEDRFDAGEIGADAYLLELGEGLGARVDRKLWAAARCAAMDVDDTLPALLSTAREHADIAVLTNNGELLVELLPQIAPSLAAAFRDRVLCSGRFGLRKPEEHVYLEAVRVLGHAPESTLFLDNSVANVEGARRAGLQAARVATPSDLAAVLANYGLG
ncbi:HAD-IA family hydrolase [Lysobacter sp. HA18]